MFCPFKINKKPRGWWATLLTWIEFLKWKYITTMIFLALKVQNLINQNLCFSLWISSGKLVVTLKLVGVWERVVLNFYNCGLLLCSFLALIPVNTPESTRSEDLTSGNSDEWIFFNFYQSVTKFKGTIPFNHYHPHCSYKDIYCTKLSKKKTQTPTDSLIRIPAILPPHSTQKSWNSDVRW